MAILKGGEEYGQFCSNAIKHSSFELRTYSLTLFLFINRSINCNNLRSSTWGGNGCCSHWTYQVQKVSIIYPETEIEIEPSGHRSVYLMFFKHWLPRLSKPYYLIIFVNHFLHYINVVTGQFVCKYIYTFSSTMFK